MSKYIQIETPLGRFNIPLSVVTLNRAAYHLKYGDDSVLDNDDDDSIPDEYTDIHKLASSYESDDQDYDNIEWLQDCMTWDDVKKICLKVDTFYIENSYTNKYNSFWEDIDAVMITIKDNQQSEMDFKTNINTISHDSA